MSICVLYNYKVKFKQKRSYQDNDPEFEQAPFIVETNKWQRTMPGFELLNYIMKVVQDTNMFEIHFGTDNVVIELFDPWTGNSEDITISWEEKDEYKDTKKH